MHFQYLSEVLLLVVYSSCKAQKAEIQRKKSPSKSAAAATTASVEDSVQYNPFIVLMVLRRQQCAMQQRTQRAALFNGLVIMRFFVRTGYIVTHISNNHIACCSKVADG